MWDFPYMITTYLGWQHVDNAGCKENGDPEEDYHRIHIPLKIEDLAYQKHLIKKVLESIIKYFKEPVLLENISLMMAISEMDRTTKFSVMYHGIQKEDLFTDKYKLVLVMKRIDAEKE